MPHSALFDPARPEDAQADDTIAQARGLRDGGL
jgi:hypothetical protein